MHFAADWTAGDRRWRELPVSVWVSRRASGETVLDVPATLAARARLLATGHGRKTDRLDAESVASVAQRASPRNVAAEDDTVLRLLSDHRDDLVNQRTRTLNRLHRRLSELVPGGVKRQLSTLQAADILRGVRPLTCEEIDSTAGSTHSPNSCATWLSSGQNFAAASCRKAADGIGRPNSRRRPASKDAVTPAA